MSTVTRENWRDQVAESGLTLAALGPLTGVSFSLVYAYSRGARKPTDAWLQRLEGVLRYRSMAWTCSECGTVNTPDRHGCKGCARAFDGYAPGVIRATPHGSAQ